MFKAVIFVCAQVLFVQLIAGQCIGHHSSVPVTSAHPCSTTHLGHTASLSSCGYGISAIPASSGGGLEVFSSSAFSPDGLSVFSENAIEGNLAAAGALPFLGAVALEGVLPSSGIGAVNYGCGNGEVAILAEDNASSSLAGSLGSGAFGSYFGHHAAAESIGPGGFGCGCGRLARPTHISCGCGSIF
ncbi:chorion class B protein PC10-like [Melitaea cinxia]|uniref:chorion class B protein PC10-like n=1 Tax=Melitaea cinxia TaxID=113334 RepID=UPI001E270FB8|nr:chorion class B protein PC10-like [Melitaea cinxia]